MDHALGGEWSIDWLPAKLWESVRRTDRAINPWQPVCLPVSAAAYAARGYRARERAMDYEGATVTRQFGHVMGKDVDTPGGWRFVTHPVCQPDRGPRQAWQGRGVLRARPWQPHDC